MDMVSEFMIHNDIKINCKKSSYHWRSLCKAEVSFQGEKLKEESSDGWFTYLGWTTNLELDWGNQIDTLIEKYQNAVKLLLSEKGLTVDQKIRTINAIANSTIAYRTKLMYSMDNLWLELLDKWTIKNLNWLGKLPWETDPAYWYEFRGARSLYIDCTTSYVNHQVNRICNDQFTCDAVRSWSIRTAQPALKKLAVTLHDGRSDKIEALSLTQSIIQTLHRADIRYIPQLCHNGKALSLAAFRNLKIALKTQEDHDSDDELDTEKFNWGGRVLPKVRKFLKLAGTQNTTKQPLSGEIDIFTDGSVKNNRATVGVYIRGVNAISYGFSALGEQEVNNAELQGVKSALRKCRSIKIVNSFCDNENAVKFTNKNWLLSNCKINNSANAESKLQIQALLREKLELSGSVVCQHVRSHASDTSRPDHEKRRKQNKERFGDKCAYIEEGNEISDEAANTDWSANPIFLQNSIRKYVIQRKNILIIELFHIKLREQLYEERRQDWIRRQPVQSALTHPDIHPASLPSRNEPYANLTCRLTMGSIWTQKLKERRKLAEKEDVNCRICGRNDILVMEDSDHALGLCPESVKQHDTMWAEIKKIIEDHGMSHENIYPWFSNSTWKIWPYSVPQYICHRGLIPTQVWTDMYRQNRHVEKITVKNCLNEINSYYRWGVRTLYLARMKLIHDMSTSTNTTSTVS
jgi:ribonuclease HI